MNPEAKKLWVDALRSGRYEQGRQWLQSESKFCCLGVLCEIAVERGITTFGGEHNEHSGVMVYDSGSTGLLPTSVATWIDMPPAIEGTLVTMNDSEKATFQQIADYIERLP